MPKAPCRARFRTAVGLRASRRWRFRYVLDGERWENDWAADDYLPNSHGADDSVVDPPISRPSRWPRSPPADEAGNAGGVTARPPDEGASTGLPAGARKTAAAGAGTCKRAATATAEKGYRRGRPRRR